MRALSPAAVALACIGVAGQVAKGAPTSRFSRGGGTQGFYAGDNVVGGSNHRSHVDPKVDLQRR